MRSALRIILFALDALSRSYHSSVGSDSIFWWTLRYFGAECFSVPLASLSRKDMASETTAEDDDDGNDDIV